jgi:hypothetical protein
LVVLPIEKRNFPRTRKLLLGLTDKVAGRHTALGDLVTRANSIKPRDRVSLFIRSRLLARSEKILTNGTSALASQVSRNDEACRSTQGSDAGLDEGDHGLRNRPIKLAPTLAKLGTRGLYYDTAEKNR